MENDHYEGSAQQGTIFKQKILYTINIWYLFSPQNVKSNYNWLNPEPTKKKVKFFPNSTHNNCSIVEWMKKKKIMRKT